VEWVTTTILLDRLGDFDDAVWGRFTDRFRGPLIEFSRRYGFDEETAQDVAQDTLLAFARGFRDGRYDRTRGRLRSWLFGIAYREIARRLRDDAVRARQAPKSSRRTSFLESVPDEAEAGAVWERAWERHVFAECIETVRQEVGAGTFLAFELVALRGVSAADVARELGITRNAVFLAKHRVLRRLETACRAFEADA
jgi:RNA polymerase sigma-70 factor (ECF subfamily)